VVAARHTGVMNASEPVHHIRPGERVEADPTPGMTRERAIEVDGLWAGLVRTEPAMTSGWHHHGDYETSIYVAKGTLRMESGPGGAEVIGHTLLASSLDTYQFDPRPAKPTVTYDTERVVRLGGVEARVLHLGRAHTGGDSVVYFPDVRVVATSDAVTTGSGGPLVDYAGGGSAVGWTPVLDAMLKLDFLNDAAGGKADLDRYLQEAPTSHAKRQAAEEKRKELGK